MPRLGAPCLAAMIAIAGGVAAAGVVYENGVRSPWLDRFYSSWIISSDGLATRAYQRQAEGDKPGAMALFQLALRRDPASPYRWCDYGEALLAAGDRAEARNAMLRGICLGPYIGPILMRGINFAYRTDEPARALEYSNRLLAITPAYDDAIFTVWERMELPLASILEKGIPSSRPAQMYLRRLMSASRSAGGAQPTWAWIRQRGYADDRLADEYIAFLLRLSQPAAAADAWASYVRGREPGYPASTAVFNGSFERDPIGTVFDWRIDSVEGALAERDTAFSAVGHCSLRLSFDRTQNIPYQHVSQRVVVKPGAWQFEARIRTEAITTDEGLGFRIFDAEAPARLDVRTERLTGTHEWTKLTTWFRVPAATRVLQVTVVRNSSWKFDNKLGGSAWIDGVTLRRGT